jgi:hypothetical protein
MLKSDFKAMLELCAQHVGDDYDIVYTMSRNLISSDVVNEPYTLNLAIFSNMNGVHQCVARYDGSSCYCTDLVASAVNYLLYGNDVPNVIVLCVHMFMSGYVKAGGNW